MTATIRRKKSLISALLSFFLLITALMPLGVVQAAGGISLIGFSNSTTPTNPHITYSSTITIQGYYLDVDGDDLRYRLTTLSGNEPSDTSSIKPSLDTANRIFTFRDISLVPGVNVISFYTKNGDISTDLMTVYVQYNNTPLFSDLRVNSVFLESEPTVVEVTSTNNLTLTFSGKANNADTVTVKNTTTGETFSDDVNTSGNFSVDLEALVGLNKLSIYAYSQNREVALTERNIIVVPISSVQGNPDQLYDVTITEKTGGTEPVTNVNQIPPVTTDLVETSAADADFELNGKLLIKVQSGATVLDGLVPDTTAPEAPVVNPVDSNDTTVTGIAEAGSTVTVSGGTIPTGTTAVAGSNGNFTINIPAAQSNGTTLTVTATDGAGNTSTATNLTVIAVDTTPPVAPSVDQIYDNDITVTGTTEPGATVVVEEGGVPLGSATADTSGRFVVVLPATQTATDTLDVIATDAANNSSTPTTVTVQTAPAPDTAAPKAPAVNPVDSDDLAVTGVAEPGQTVTVWRGSTSLGTAAADGAGNYSVPIVAQAPGTALTVTVTDAATNTSPGTTIAVLLANTAAPATAATIENNDTAITGNGVDPGATVVVKRGATVLGTAVADGGGNFSVTISPPNVGDELSVMSTNGAGQSGTAAQVNVTSADTFTLTWDRLDTTDPLDDIQVTATVAPIPVDTLPSDYKLYSVQATVDDADPDLVSGGSYAMVLKYQVRTVDPISQTNIITEATVANFPYEFVYSSATEPRFGAVTDVSSSSLVKSIQTDGSTNIVSVLPAKVAIETNNMSVLPADYEVYFNNSLTPLAQGTDYLLTLTNDEAVNATIDADAVADPVALIEFLQLPANETNVKVVYTPDNDEISFKLKPEVVPSLLFYYTSAGLEKVIDDTLEITDPNATNFIVDSNKFRGKLYNYKLTATNMQVTLNGNAITYSLPVDPDPTDNIIPFEIDKSQFLTGTAWDLEQGNNALVFELLDDPSVKFTYNIFFNTGKTPRIEDVELRVVQGKDDVELAKTSSESAYRTSALFLREFSFRVANVDPGAIVTIRKDGNVIAKYNLTDASGDWDFLNTDSDYVKARDAAIYGNTSALGPIFDDSTFSQAQDIINGFTFRAEMEADEYGEELVGELDQDMGLNSEELENRLKLFPLTLAKGGTTSYQIEIVQGSVVTRQTITIQQETFAWQVIYPEVPENATYATVNTNMVPIRIFAEGANRVLIGKTEALAYNTTDPDFVFDEDTGKLLPQTYYVFEANVSLKPGVNTIKFTVEFDNNSYDDEIKIYHLNSAVTGAETRDVLGKKTTFSVFEKAFELKFPSGTVLLAPSSNRVGSEVNVPESDIFTDVPIYFGIADRSTGRVLMDDDSLRDDMEDLLRISSNFNYASPLYYVDAGNSEPGSVEGDDDRAPGGRDPYYEGTVNNRQLEPFIDRWQDNLVPSKPGTVTIKYDPSIVNAAHNTLTIFYNNGDEWQNIGGVVNFGKKTISAPFKGFGYYMVMKTRETYGDVIDHPFARDAIETLFSKGVMNDAPGSGFGTELKINRGEFATMIVKALDLPINAGPYRDNNENDPAEPTFRDVMPSDDDWDYQYKYIETAARAGIVRGKDPGLFYPDDPLTREEAAVIIARALNFKLTNPDAAKGSVGKMFTDGTQIEYYAAPSVLAVAKAKIMVGEVNDPTAKRPTYRFNPKGDLTRAEMAVITVRIMQQLKKLPKT